MSDKYGYQSLDGSRITVGSYFDEVNIYVADGESSTVNVPCSEAPALALAILTTAKVRSDVSPQECADPREAAAYYLAEWVRDQADEKARIQLEDAQDALSVPF